MRNISIYYQFRYDDGAYLTLNPIYKISQMMAEVRGSDLTRSMGESVASLNDDRQALQAKYKAIKASEPSTASGAGVDDRSLVRTVGGKNYAYNSSFNFNPLKRKQAKRGAGVPKLIGY